VHAIFHVIISEFALLRSFLWGGWHDFHIHYTALSSIAFSKLKIIVKYYLRMEKSDKSLILVSNRLPFQLLEQDDQLTMKQSDGGLVTALISYFIAESNRDVFQQKKWFWLRRLSRKKMEEIQKAI
jgi:hypothetical protein